MFKHQDIIVAIEIGTSKICVLVGAAREDGTLTVIGRGESASAGAVVKGEIVDMDLALEKLTAALEAADHASGREIANRKILALSVTACNINSYLGVGTVFINSEDQRIDEMAIRDAVRNAHVKQLPQEQTLINTYDAYFLLDGGRRVRNPENQVARKLEAYQHVIHGDTNRIENFRSLLHDAGFEEEPHVVFSGIADIYGILSDEEKEMGVLLVDLGAGTTEYSAVFNVGVLASGVLPIGLEHIANDLSLGLGLPVAQCRKLLQEGVIEEAIRSGRTELEIKGGEGGGRRIPVASFERIIELRLRELFTIIKHRIVEQELLRNLSRGGVLTGGGAHLDVASEIFHSVFEFPVRLGRPYDASGALTDLENPRYSTVLGTLRFGEECRLVEQSMTKRGMLGRFGEMLGEFSDRSWRGVGDLFSSIKF